MNTVHSLISRGAALAARDGTADFGEDSKILNLMIVILALVFSAILLVGVLLFFRRLRKQQQMRNGMLPTYHDNPRAMKQQGLSVQATQNGRASVLVINRDGQPMLSNPTSAPHSQDNVPEIHITFPDEHDDAGRRQSGRVVVVRVGDGGVVGLEPVREEQLPAYEKDSKTEFYSLDMNQIGGLREKERFDFR